MPAGGTDVRPTTEAHCSRPAVRPSLERYFGRGWAAASRWYPRGGECGWMTVQIAVPIAGRTVTVTQRLSAGGILAAAWRWASRWAGLAGQVGEAVWRLGRGGADAWVVDVRGNGGGLVRAAQEAAWAVLGAPAPLVQVCGGGRGRGRWRARREGAACCV
jgi:hypothetical protein